MVGVPGRSKGCLTCRERRKGCDLQRPTCGRCQRIGVECHYNKPLIFVNSTKQHPRGVKHETTSTTVSTSSAAATVPGAGQNRHSWPSAPAVQRVLDLSGSNASSQGATSSDSDAASVVGSPAPQLEDEPSRAPSRAPSRVPSRASFKAARSPTKASRNVTPSSRTRPLSLLDLFSDTEQHEFTAYQSEGSPQVHGYSDVEELSVRGISTPEPQPMCHVAVEYENEFAPDPRLQILFTAIKNRRKPTSDKLRRKSPISAEDTQIPDHKDALLDIMMDMPELLEDLDAMRSAATAPTQQQHHYEPENRRSHWQQLRSDLMWKCRCYDEKLVGWVRSVSPSSSESPELFGSSYQPPTADRVSPAQLAHAHGLSLYWTAYLLLCSTLELASAGGRSSPSPDLSSSGGPSSRRSSAAYSVISGLSGTTAAAGGTPSERADPRVYIRRIASVVPVLLSPGSGAWGRQMAALPLGLALLFAAADDGMAEEQAMLASCADGAFMDELISGIFPGGGGVSSDSLRAVAPWARNWVAGG